MSCKQKRKKDRLSKIYLACLCASTTETLSIFYKSIYFWMVLPFNTFMPDGNKRSQTLKNPAIKRCWFISLYGVLVPPIMKGLTRSMFMATFSALQETIKNKIK